MSARPTGPRLLPARPPTGRALGTHGLPAHSLPARGRPVRRRARGRAALTLLVLAGLAWPARADILKVPAQYPTVQAAIDAAVPGDTVTVAKGRYRENLVIGTGPLTLKGPGAVIDGGYAGPCLVVSADEVLVQGLTLANGATGVRVEGTIVALVQLTVLAADGPGIEILADVVLASKCRVDGARGPGLRIALVEDDDGALVSNCRILRCAGDGIAFGPRGYLLAVGNRCERNSGSGLALQLDNPSVGEIPRLYKNTLRDNGGAGLAFDSPGGVDANGNRCERNAGPGVLGRGYGFTLDKCKLLANGGAGAQLVALAGSSATGCLMRDNGREGLRFTTDEGFVLGRNGIVDCLAARNGRDGILVEGGPLDLLDCRSLDNLGDGIDLDGTQDAALVRLVALRNGHEGLDNDGVVTVADTLTLKQNGGLDLAGAGDGAGGFPPGDKLVFGTGSADATQSLDLAPDA